MSYLCDTRTSAEPPFPILLKRVSEKSISTSLDMGGGKIAAGSFSTDAPEGKSREDPERTDDGEQRGRGGKEEKEQDALPSPLPGWRLASDAPSSVCLNIRH